MNARREHLLRAFALDERVSQLADALDDAAAGASVEAEFEQARAAAAAAWESYAAGLTPQRVSRCPYTGAVLEWTIDHAGLDGPWWNRDAPLRPCERLLPTVHSLSGAVRLAAPLESAPFIGAPGPAVPWVAPEILAQPGVRAVLSCLPIGAHTGYLVAYYVEPGCSASGGLADWGIGYQLRRDDAGEVHYRLPDPADPLRDFELSGWIAAGKLLWIAPGDAGLRLRATRAGCPYLDLPGPREPAQLLQGRVWIGARIVEDEPA